MGAPCIYDISTLRVNSLHKKVKHYGYEMGNKYLGWTTEELVLEFPYWEDISLTFKLCRRALPDHHAPTTHPMDKAQFSRGKMVKA